MPENVVVALKDCVDSNFMIAAIDVRVWVKLCIVNNSGVESNACLRFAQTPLCMGVGG